MTRTPRRKAFTLLELILSMAIVAMLTLALYSALSAAYRARRTAQSQTVGVRSASIVLDLIEQDLRSVMPPTPVSTAASTSTTAGVAYTLNGPFMGYPPGSGGSQSAQIDCYSMSHSFDTPDSPFAEGVRHVVLGMGQEGQKPALIRQVVRNLLTQTADVPPTEILANYVKTFTVQYYDGTNWTDTWDSTQSGTLPMAVDITLEVIDDPTTTPPHTYKASRLIALPCAQSATSIAADAATAATAAGGAQ